MKYYKQVEKTDDFELETYHLRDKGLHRENGPAYILTFNDGTGDAEWWYYHNKIHRYGGPSITNSFGNLEYHVHGNDVSGVVFEWLKERGYTWNSMSDIEKWELEMFMRTLG